MAEITIPKIDDELLARLCIRAAAAGRSVEQEIREILTAACVDQASVVARLRDRHASHGQHLFSDSAELVREMRDRRTL